MSTLARNDGWVGVRTWAPLMTAVVRQPTASADAICFMKPYLAGWREDGIRAMR